MLKFLKKLIYFVLSIFMTLVLLYLVREPLLRGVGKLLIAEDTPMPVEAAFILSGYVLERCTAGAEVYKQGMTPKLIVTGENTNQALQAVGMEITEAELAYRALRKLEVDSAAIEVIERGTSTFEESDEILGISQTRGYSRIMIITSKFHTRRVRSVFRDKFREAGIEIILRGAEPLEYDIDRWWESESAMIFVNNEYIKAVYYWLKY